MPSTVLTAEDIKLFRRIPRRTIKVKLISSFPNAFTGKECLVFLKNTFDFNDAQAEKWGNLLIQGNVLKRLNFRLTSTFRPKTKYIYSLFEEGTESLFWLEDNVLDDEENSASDSDCDIIHSASFMVLDGKDIPEVPALPFIGNAFDVAGPLDTHRSMCILGRELCKKYGGIFRITLMGHNFIVVSDPDIVQEVFESPNFGKKTENDPIFKELRSFRGEGLTTVSDGPLHAQCQAVIAPQLIKSCFMKYIPVIAETINQCFREDLGKDKKDVDMRYLWKKSILRSVGKVAMSIDLYDGNKWKSFCENLTYVADEAINRVFKGTKLIPFFVYKFKTAVKSMNKKILRVVVARREQHKMHGKDPKSYDLLDIMLTTPISTDSNGNKTYMSDEIIRANLTTILSAGHSTTTSMLSWTCNFLYDQSLGNNDYRYNLIQEISNVSGGDRRYIPTLQDVYKNLPFMTCVLKESLRLCPPIPTIVRHCLQTTNLAGYKVQRGEAVMISCLGTHLNEKSWDDPNLFNPNRFMGKPPNKACSFIPWAGGARQCIGREFALLSGRIGLFLLMNQYSLELSANARVREDEHLFVFPEGLLMNAVIRKDVRRDSKKIPVPKLQEKNQEKNQEPQENKGPSDGARAWDGLKALIRESGHKVNILSGTKSSSGNTNAIAQLLLDKALSFNFQTGDSPMSPNSFFDTLTEPPNKFTVVALVLSTYQGNPAPNTRTAYNWLASKIKRLEEGDKSIATYLSNVRYFVFGCGNMNWVTTYQKVSKYFDENLAKLGAKRICPLGLFDESQDDREEEFSLFYKTMAPALMHSLPEIGDKRLRAVDASSIVSKPAVEVQAPSSALNMDIIGDAEDLGTPPIIPSTVTKKIHNCKIIRMEDITPGAISSTLHIEIEMKPGMKYRAGDHLGICPVMPMDLVDRVLSKFVDFDESTIVRWAPQFQQSRRSIRFHLPVGVSMTIENIFRNLLDLKAIPSKQFLMNLSTIVEKESHAIELKEIASDIGGYKAWLSKNAPISNVDIIEKYSPKSSELGRLMEILPVLRPRPYSICSSPKQDSSTVQVCVGVIEHNIGDKMYHGVSSYYLKTLLNDNNATVNVYTEEADESFDVPEDDNKPMIMISAGTGFAPMRSFLQERKARNAKGEIYVFFGCRHESKDWLYSNELKQYQNEGLITGMFVGFSRSQQFPRKYVQEKILEQADLVWDAIDNKGAYLYICGSGTKVGAGTREVLIQIITNKTGKDSSFAEEYLANLEANGRYEQDVWG